MKPVYLLTGSPGTGKTSLIKQAVAGFSLKAGGFYTEEIRERGTRLGFRLVTLDGREAVLSHVDFSKRFRIGKYGVDLSAMERFGIPSLQQAAAGGDLVVIDEIGKMEILSRAFRETVAAIIGSGKRVLGTIMLQSNAWADTIKRRPGVRLVTVTGTNSPQVREDLQQWLQEVNRYVGTA
jgi:nucleoside-triphosphatase